MALRVVAFTWIYLAVEMVGLARSVAAWALTAGGRLVGRRRYTNLHFKIQAWALQALFDATRVIFRLTFHVEGQEAAARGPIVLLVRHASMVDTLLPGVLVANPHGIKLRYVLKQELLQDPIFDVVGSRLPNHFVDRNPEDSRNEVAQVRALARDLAHDEGVIIYPEGTRFTPAKKQRALERMAAGDPELSARAAAMEHVMPPRLGGTRAILEAAAGVDVVVCAHVGLDGFAEVKDIWAGSMVGKEVWVRFWRIPGADVPRQRRAQTAWLFDQWEAVDRWIDEKKTGAA